MIDRSNLDKIFQSPAVAAHAIKYAVQQAVIRHKQTQQPMISDNDGVVIAIPPDRLPELKTSPTSVDSQFPAS